MHKLNSGSIEKNRKIETCRSKKEERKIDKEDMISKDEQEDTSRVKTSLITLLKK